MLKFFRKIRQRLLSESKFSKYLLYAIGEIVLVVIGILIALQINTWNTQNQRHKQEISILKEILVNLKDDIEQIDDELYSDKVVMDADSVLISYIRSGGTYNDSLAEYLKIAEMFPHLDSKESGFILLESKGIDLIANDSLRIRLTDFYNRDYPYFRKYENERLALMQSIIKPYMTKHFYLEPSLKWPYSKRQPIKLETFTNDAELVSILQTSYDLSNTMYYKGAFLKEKAVALQNHINNYLKQQE